MHALQKLHKKWPPDHYLVLRVSYFDTPDVKRFFPEREESISFKLAISAYESNYFGSGIYIFKKGITSQEMFDFIKKHDANFPDDVQIRGYYFFKVKRFM